MCQYIGFISPQHLDFLYRSLLNSEKHTFETRVCRDQLI